MLMGAYICWVATDTDKPFTSFDLSGLKRQLLQPNMARHNFFRMVLRIIERNYFK